MFRKPVGGGSFESEVRRRFGPLAAKWGMSRPIDDRKVMPAVSYRLAGLIYEWLYDPAEQAVYVLVLLDENGVRHSMFLDRLVVATGLGAPQHVRTGAKTARALQQAVRSQTEYLDLLHNRLTHPQAAAFLTRAGADQHHIDQLD